MNHVKFNRKTQRPNREWRHKSLYDRLREIGFRDRSATEVSRLYKERDFESIHLYLRDGTQGTMMEWWTRQDYSEI